MNKKTYCSNFERIKLDELLHGTSSFVVEVDSEEKDLCLFLVFDPGEEVQSLCYQIEAASTSYPHPKYFSGHTGVSENSLLCIQKYQDTYLVMLTLSHSGRIVSLNPHDSDSISLKIEGFRSPERGPLPVFIAAKGECLSTLLKNLFCSALQLTGNFGRDIREKPLLPEWLDYLGFDTGSGHFIEITHANIVGAITRLKEAGYTPSYVVIGEGWQGGGDNNQTMMKNYDADPIKFPNGLKGVVEELGRLGVSHVGVRHVTTSARESTDLGSSLGEAFEFYNVYCRYLREQGITFVTVSHDLSIGEETIHLSGDTERYKNLMQAIQAAASIHLDCSPFVSGSLRNEHLYYWSTARLASCTEKIDYSDPLGVKRFIRNNLTNSLWLRYLMEPDFDSWITSDPMSGMMAMFHAISGTVNKISDIPASTSKHLLDKILLPSGEILKTDVSLTLCDDCLFVDPLEEKKIYKCYTRKNDSGIIGVFNLTKGKKNLHEMISPGDVKGLIGEFFAVYSFKNGYLGVFSFDDRIPVTLKPNGSDIFTFVPINTGIAVFGCYHYYLPSGPIRDITVEENSLHITSAVTAPLLAYCQKEVLEIRRNGQVIPWDHDSKISLLSIDSRSEIRDLSTIYTITFE